MQKAIRYNNHQLYYQVRGEGMPIVLIHGFAEDGNVWKYQLPALEKHYKLIIPDLPGSGKSVEWEDLSMEALAEAVRMILKEENIDQITIIGHSMGGYVTLAFAEKYPELLQSFGLFHSTAYADTEEKKTTRKKSIEFIKTHGSYEFLKQSSPNTFGPESRERSPEQVKELIEEYKNFNPKALIGYYEAMIKRPDRTEVLKKFNKPVLFIIGKNDNAIPLNDSLQQCHLPVFSYIYILKQSGHMGMWEEATESNRVLKDFLGRQ